MMFWPKTDVPENKSGREYCWPFLIGQHPLSLVFGHFMFLSGGLLDYSNISAWTTRIIKSKISPR